MGIRPRIAHRTASLVNIHFLMMLTRMTNSEEENINFSSFNMFIWEYGLSTFRWYCGGNSRKRIAIIIRAHSKLQRNRSTHGKKRERNGACDDIQPRADISKYIPDTLYFPKVSIMVAHFVVSAFSYFHFLVPEKFTPNHMPVVDTVLVYCIQLHVNQC